MLFSEAVKSNPVNITNKRILKLCNDCMDTLISKGFKIDKSEIELKEERMGGCFAWLMGKYNPNENYILCINTLSYDSPDDVLKNTIYHELCHYLNYKFLFDSGLWYYKGNETHCKPEYLKHKRYYDGHGTTWKGFAAKVGKAVGTDIQRCGKSDEVSADMKADKESRYKWKVECESCGWYRKYFKTKDFVKYPNQKVLLAYIDHLIKSLGYERQEALEYIRDRRPDDFERWSTEYRYRCPKCGSKGQFKTTKLR